MPNAKKLLVAIAAVAAMATPSMAQDYGPYGYGGFGFDWNGFYAGVYGGGVPLGDTPSWSAGVFTGVNVQIESFVVGAEAQLGADIGGAIALDALFLGRGGMAFGDALVYATAGGGMVSGDVGYAFGGGAEYGFTDYMSVRLEGLGLGEWGQGPSDARIAAGVAFHL